MPLVENHQRRSKFTTNPEAAARIAELCAFHLIVIALLS
jgi:hypothetical protein